MHLRRFVHHGLLLLLMLSVMLPSAAVAQDTSIANGQRTVAAGDVFEILGISADADARFDWVLTTDGSFVEAGREKLFRTRMTQEGTYTLDGQFTSVAGTRRLHLTIDVTAPREELPPEEDTASDTPGLQIVELDAPSENSAVRLNPESPVLTLTPSPVFSGPITGDLDTREDADGDGDPGNDNDLGDTLFSTEHNPLQLWFADENATAAIALSTEADDGTTLGQDFVVTAGSGPLPVGNIDVGEEKKGTVSFSFPLPTGIDPATIVEQWFFGDGGQSLKDNPTHHYLRNDLYDVNVIVRELSTGHVLAEGEGTVDITDAPKIVVSVSSSASSGSSASSASSSPTSPSSAGGGSVIWTLVKILGVLLAAAALGAGGVWAFRKFPLRGGGLQKALESAESKLLKPVGGPAASSTDEPVALQLKRPAAESTPAPSPPSLETEIAAAKKSEPPAPPALPPTEAAPSWLQKGLAKASVPSSPAVPMTGIPATAAPPPVPGDPFATQTLPTTTAPSAPTPSFDSTQEDHTLSEDDLLPPWLKEDQQAASQTAPSATTTPIAPVPDLPTEAPAVAKVGPEPVPASAPPSWLTAAEPAAQPAPTVPAIQEQTPVVPPVQPKPEPPAPVPTPPVIPVEKPVTPPLAPVEPRSTAPSEPPSNARVPDLPAVVPAGTEVGPGPGPEPASSPAPTLSAEDQDRLERERERKRRKRQRYRENLKKRKVTGGPETDPDSGSESESEEIVSPAPVAAPAKIETKAIVKVSPPPMPAKIEPKPVAVTKMSPCGAASSIVVTW